MSAPPEPAPSLGAMGTIAHTALLAFCQVQPPTVVPRLAHPPRFLLFAKRHQFMIVYPHTRRHPAHSMPHPVFSCMGADGRRRGAGPRGSSAIPRESPHAARSLAGAAACRV